MSTIVGFGIWAIIIVIYWAPTIVGHDRKVKNLGTVAVLNFFGFLVITWIVALAWACSDSTRQESPRPQGRREGEVPLRRVV